MHANSKSFLMAIVVGTTSLVLTQIYGPDHLKPLTNRLVSYPGSVPALNLKNGIFESTFTPAKLVSALPLSVKNAASQFLPQSAVIAIVTDERGYKPAVKPSVKPSVKPVIATPKPIPKDERDDVVPSVKPSTKPASPTPKPTSSKPPQDCRYNGSFMECKPETVKTPSPTPVKTPTPTPTPAPTKKPDPTPTAEEKLDQARQDAYTSTYGTEAGRYNYNYETGKAATTAEWNDPKAVIAGTYVAPNGKRYSVNIGTTNAAGNDLMNKVSSSIATLSDQEILDLAKSRNQSNPCSAVDTVCQQKIIQATLAQITKDSFAGNVPAEMIAAITDAQHKNAVATAKFQAQIKDFMDPTKSLNDLAECNSHPGECHGLTLEGYLKEIGVDPKDIPSLLEGRSANVLALQKAKEVQRIQIDTVNKFFTKSEEELKKEYCPPGTNATRCQALLSGGILTDVGITPEDAKKFVTQKQAAITVSQYETGSLAVIEGKPVDYQQLYKSAYTVCMAQSQGRDKNCEAKATAEAERKAVKLTTPIDYQSKYDQGYNSCMTGSHGRGDCVTYAVNYAQTAVNNSTTGAINVPKVELANLTASCLALGGKNCGTSEAALTSLAKLTGNPELTLATIELQKLQIEQEQKAYANISGTLNNLGTYDQVSKEVMDGKKTWVEVQAILDAQRQDGWTNAVIGWNDLTGGRFKRGNDLMMSQYQDCTGDTIWSCDKVEDFSRWTVTKGALIQGGDAAMVVTAAVALPLAPAFGLGAGAVFGTGVGVAASAQMVGTAADTCELAKQGKATQSDCNTAIAMASISVVGTGLGVIGEATKLVQTGQQVSNFTKTVGTFTQGATISKTIAVAEVANDVVSAGTFGKMAFDTCEAAGPESLDCISSVAMAIASGGKLLTTGSNLYAKAANVEQSVGGVSDFSTAALQKAHTISADLFVLSACSKMLDPEIAKNTDTISMCAFGLSGAVQTHVMADLAPVDPTKDLKVDKTPLSDVTLSANELAEYNTSKENISIALKEVEALTKTYETTSGKVQKEILIQLNEAKNKLASVEQAHATVIAKINAEQIAATASLAKAKLEVERWSKSVEGTSGTVRKDAIVQLNDAKIALSLAETANKIAAAKVATVKSEAPAPVNPPAPPPQNNQPDGSKPQGILAKIGEFFFGKENAPIHVGDRKISLNEEFKGLVEKLGEIKNNRGESALSGKDPVLVAETRTVDGKPVTQFKFNESNPNRAGMTDGELVKLNQVFSDFQAFSEKNIGFDQSKGIRGQQADYLVAGLEAFAQHGSTGSLFGALPGLGKTEVILPMMTYLHASMTNDPQFVLFPEVKLMRPWLTIDSSGKAVKNAEIITFFEKKFGEGSVLILEPGHVPTAAEVGKAKVIVATRDAAFDLQSIDTLGGRALREKWANSYKFVDESHWTTNLFENFRRSGAASKISEIAEANVFKSAIESVRKLTSVNELVEARKSGTTLDVALTSDGKGEYSAAREVKILTELLEKNKSILPDNLKNLELNEHNLAESKKLIDQFVDQNFSQPKVKNFAAELTTINKLADLLASVPGTHYGLAQKGGEYSIAPREQSRPTGRTYSNLAEQLIYNKVGVEILKGVGEMKSSININVDNLTVSRGGTETTYARLMLEGKGFAMFTGTPELMARLYKIAYGIELKVFSASAFETVAIRFTSGDKNGIFTSIVEQVKARLNEGKNQVYTLMDSKTSNVETTERLLSAYNEGDKVFIVKASGEMVEGKVTGGKFEQLKTFDSVEALGIAQEVAGKYVKIYEFGAHTGVDTPNNVDLSRAVGICNGCDQTTFSQGINRVRLDANGNASPMDIIILDAALASTPKEQLFNEFAKLTAANEAHNLTVAEVNFKEILLKTSIDIAFERMLAKAGDGVLGALLDGGLKAKLEAIQGSWKSISEYSYKLDNTNLTPEQKLARTLEKVQGVMKSVDSAIGNNKAVRAEFDSAVGGYSELTIKFKETETFKPLGDKPSLGDVVELINNSSADLITTTVTFREKGASGETIAVAGQEAVRNLESNSPTLLQRTQTFIKNIGNPVIVPRSMAILTTTASFKSFSTEDEDGNILRIYKDSTGKLVFEESNQDVGMSSSREFNITDLDLFPPASQTVATRYNDELIENSSYSRNAIVPGKNNSEELKKILDSDGFAQLGIALANGDTVTIETTGSDITVTTKTANGKTSSRTPTNQELETMLEEMGDQIVALARNGEDVPLMTYLNLPSEKQPLLTTLASLFKSPSVTSFFQDLSENYLLAQVQPVEQETIIPDEENPENAASISVKTETIETKTTTEKFSLKEQDNINIFYILPSKVSTNRSSNLRIVVDAKDGLAKSRAALMNVGDYPIILSINGQRVAINPNEDITIKTNDQFEYGYQTIKLLAIESKKRSPKINLEITTISQSFDPRQELSNLSKTSLNSGERRSNLTAYKAKLVDRYSKLQVLYNDVIKIVNQDEYDEATIQKMILDTTVSMRLSDIEISRIQKAVHNYLLKIEKIKTLILQYPTPEELFEAAFGSKPNGKIKLEVKNTTIDFITTNDADFALAFYKSNPTTGQSTELTSDMIANAIRFSGFAINNSTDIEDTENIFTVNKQLSKSVTQGILIHERQHAFYADLKIALGIGVYEVDEIKKINILENELRLLSSTDPNIIKKSTFYKSEFPKNTSNSTSSGIDQDKKIKALSTVTKEYAYMKRKEAEDNVANELLARLTQNTEKSWNIKSKVKNPDFQKDILDYISNQGIYKRDNPSYNFFEAYRDNNFYLESFNGSWTTSTDTRESSIIQIELDLAFSNSEQSRVAKRAIEAYTTLILKGYTNQEAVVLLSINRLSNWGAVARKLPLAQKMQVIPQTNLTRSGSSLANWFKNSYNKFKSRKPQQPTTPVSEPEETESNEAIPDPIPNSVSLENMTFDEFLTDSQSNLPTTIRVKSSDLSTTITRLLTSGPNLVYWRNIFIESQNIRAKYEVNFLSFYENGDLNEGETLKYFRNRLNSMGYKIVENSPRIKKVAESRNFDPQHINAVQNSAEKTLHLRRSLNETGLATLVHEYIHIMQGLSISDIAIRENEAYLGAIMFMELDRADGQDPKEYLEQLIDKTVNYSDKMVYTPINFQEKPQVMVEAEQKYISDKLAKIPGLDQRYAHDSTSFAGYTADMNKYIGKSKVKSAPKGNISKDGLDKVKANLGAEITRLLLNKRVRNNQEKYDIVSWQTDRFIDLLKQAIDEGNIKTDGDNVLTLQAAQDLILRNIHTLAFQDFVASENTLGDHGVRHLVDHNIKVGEKVLDLAKTNDTHAKESEQIRAIDYLILHQVMIDHDTGYAMGVVRDGVNLDATKGYDSGHNVLAAKMLRERTELGTDPLSQLFGTEGVGRIHQGIITHDSSAVDITVDRSTTVDSAIHLADNTHAFETKLPELLYGYPDSIVAMRLLKAAGELGDEKLMEEIKLQLIDNIQKNSKIGLDDKTALTHAVSSLTKNSYAFTVGRIMGNNPQITFDDTTGKIVVSVTESEIHKDVVGLFDRAAYDQLAKFIADLLGIKKADAIIRIQNNDLKFEGTSVVIQAQLGEQKDKTKTDFQQKVSDLTSQNIAFTKYLTEDDNQKDLMKSLEEEIKVKTERGDEQAFLDELARQLEEFKQARAELIRTYLVSPSNKELNKTPSLLDWFKNLFKQAPKSVVIPVNHDTKKLNDNESSYLMKFTPKMRNLQVRYDHVSSSDLGYTGSMARYVGTHKIKSPGSANVSIKGLEKIRSNVKSEVARLFNNKNKRQNPLKYKEVSWEVNRYIDLVAQAIKDGDIKTTGDNVPTLADIQAIIVRNIHTLAFQDFVATENTLGDHGVRHLVAHNIHVAEKVLDLSVENKTNSDPVRAIDYLMLHQVMIDHDTGYAVDIVRMGVNRDSSLGADSGHNVLAAKILRERTMSGLDPLSRVFGESGIARIHEGILYHDRHTVDLSVDRATTLDSAIHLADNTHAFESKLPELLYGYPDSIVAMRLLKAAGELNNPQLMEEIKKKLIQDIQNNKSIAVDDKIALSKAVTTLSPKSYAFTAGRIMGGDPVLSYENGKVVVSVTESEIHQDVVHLFDQQSYAQLAKFLEDVLKTNSKGAFLEQINGDTKRFEGETVVIQTIIGKELKNKIRTTFSDQLSDLTGKNPEFTNYLNQDDNQKDLMNSLLAEIKAKKNPPKSLTTILKTRDFSSLIITLKTGEVRVFTDILGTLSFASYADGESAPSDYNYISSSELDKYLPSLSEIQNVRRDGEDLTQGTYTVEETSIDVAGIAQLEDSLASFRDARSELIKKYLNIQDPQIEEAVVTPPVSHKVLDESLEIVITEDGYLVKSTGKLPVKSHATYFLDIPETIPAEGLTLNATFGYLKLFVGDQVYSLMAEGDILRIVNEVTGIDTLITDHATKIDAFAINFDTNLSNFAQKLANYFAPNNLVELNLNQIKYSAQSDLYIGTAVTSSEITKEILVEKIRQQNESDLTLATRKYVATYLYNSDEPDVLALEEVVRTADLLYQYLELDTYRGPLTLSNSEQLIGSPVINWSLTDNHTLNLEKIHTDDNVSIVDHLQAGHVVTIEEPSRTTVISWDGKNYLISRDFKNGSPVKKNKTKNTAYIENDYLPRAEDFNTKSYQIYIVDKNNVNLHASTLFELLIASTPATNFVDHRTPWQQFLDRFLGRTMGIVANPQLMLEDKSSTTSFEEYAAKWDILDKEKIKPLEFEIQSLSSKQAQIDKAFFAIINLIEQMETKTSLNTIRFKLVQLGYPYVTDFGHTEGDSMKILISPNQQYYKTALAWLYLQRAYGIPEVTVSKRIISISDKQIELESLIAEKHRELEIIKDTYGDSIMGLINTYDEMTNKLPRMNGDSYPSVQKWQKENASKKFKLTRKYVLGNEKILPLDQVSERHGVNFRNRNLSLNDIGFLTKWLTTHSSQIDWLKVAGQHVHEGVGKKGVYPHFDPLISASLGGVSNVYGDQQMTFYVSGSKLIPWSVIAKEHLNEINRELKSIGLVSGSEEQKQLLEQRNYWSYGGWEDEYLVIGEITLDEIISDSTHPNLRDDIDKLQNQ